MALLEVHGLVKSYGRRRVVDGVSFEVEAGEVVGLLGPNGAGKTTSFRMTTGQIAPNAGRVFFNGAEVTSLQMYKRARLGMGYLSQEPSIFRKLTVEQNVLAILEMIPALRTLGRPLSRAERYERTEAVLEQFGLTRLRTNVAGRLSGGEKRRLEIARCLVCEPLLILLDEPFTGIDPKTIADIQHIVRDLRAQGIGILITDHNVREALKITGRSYLIKDGKVRTHGTPLQIVNDPIAISEYLGATFNEPAFGEPAPAAGRQAAPRVLDFSPPARQGLGRDSASESEFPIHDDSSRVRSKGKSSRGESAEPERMQRLLEGLKTPDHARAAAELTQRGAAAVPHLLAALERRDVEIRRQSLHILQAILKRPLVFDPYAPEILRKQQLASLRDQYERKAG